MAIYHCSVKTISRSAGRSATGAAAYRAGERIEDQRTGEVYDYTRRSGVEHTELVMPKDVILEREQLWNAAEASENRKNSTVAREYEVALPEELAPEQRKALAVAFAQHLTDRYGVVADVAIHAPGREGDSRNHHAHILTTTRTVTVEGFGVKTRALDDKKTGEVEHVRQAWATLTNQALEQAGHESRIDHRSLQNQGVDREPTAHLGPAATAMERRRERSERGDLNRDQAVDRAMRVDLDEAERVQTGAARMREQAREWRKGQEQARQQALVAEKVKQQEQERLEAERKAQEKAERQEQHKSRGPSLGR